MSRPEVKLTLKDRLADEIAANAALRDELRDAEIEIHRYRAHQAEQEDRDDAAVDLAEKHHDLANRSQKMLAVALGHLEALGADEKITSHIRNLIGLELPVFYQGRPEQVTIDRAVYDKILEKVA